MPWYQSPEVSGYWGWHWTMNHFNPNSFIDNTTREIASQFYPLTGPYDSRDIDLLEYQVLLMKLSGVDGVIVDWYGIEDYADYGTINESTQELFYFIQDAQLEFSICYEDRTVQNMVQNGYFNSTEALNHGKDVMNYLQDNWFTKDCYVKLDDRPLLLSWGPLYFTSNSSWATLFSELDPKPHLYTLDNKKFDLATGAYPWPPMHLCKNGELQSIDLNLYLTQFYLNSKNWDYTVGTAFPGFYDIYEEAGVNDSYGFLDAKDGETFRTTLSTAMNYNPDILQIATWNDYGEGTIIEPTKEFGYQYLVELQNLRKENIDSNFAYTEEELKLPLIIFELRKEYANSYAVHDMLDDAFYHIIEGEIEKAKDIIYSLRPSETDDELNAQKFQISSAYPNPFNPSTNFKIEVPQSSEIDIKIYDIQGNLIEQHLNNRYNSGIGDFTWNANNISSGIYFIKFINNQYEKTQKVMLMK